MTIDKNKTTLQMSNKLVLTIVHAEWKGFGPHRVDTQTCDSYHQYPCCLATSEHKQDGGYSKNTVCLVEMRSACVRLLQSIMQRYFHTFICLKNIKTCLRHAIHFRA